MKTISLKKQLEDAESYRIPMQVTHLRVYGTTAFYICPRCHITMEREFMSYCDRCGQCLGWRYYKKAVVLK